MRHDANGVGDSMDAVSAKLGGSGVRRYNQ
jgi:hypothetical protein